MANENWQQVRNIFDDALRQKPGERAGFVSRVCGGDKLLMAEVQSLLASFDRAEGFLETPAIVKVADEILFGNRQLSNGQILGHYEIIERLGTGGMGEVYLARDTKLQRRVALKVLHRNLSSENRANRRLLREAQAAALLDHPNICQIYEISETGDWDFIVMQLVEGETLADFLAKKRLSVEAALELAIQIADALAEAHTQNIIHRDIKPANIIVNKKNQAKVLDFGLAKFIEAESSENTLQRLNSSGAVMGTVPYMSPEQLCGKRLDAATDVFSFGAMFYEMLTGQQAFARENNAEIISAILNDEPLLTKIPEKLHPILQKSLMKNKAERYRTAKDLARDLRAAQKSGGSSAAGGDDFGGKQHPENFSTLPVEQRDSGEQASFDPTNRRFYFWNSSNTATLPTEKIGGRHTGEVKFVRFNTLSVWLSAVIFFLVVGASVSVYRQFNDSDDSRSFDALRPARLVSWKASAGAFFSDYRLSHSGKLIAYSSSQDGGKENIYIKQTADGEELRVTRDDWTNVCPIWSPDDQRIAYSSQRENQSGIYISPAFGGAAVLLKAVGNGDIFLRHWSKDGSAIFYEYQGNLFRLDAATREVIQVTDFPASPAEQRYFSLSPDEDRIVFCDKNDGQTDIWLMPLNGGEKLRLTKDGSEKRRPRWHPDGKRILYNVRRDDFQQIGLAYADGRDPVQVTRGDSQYEMIDVSADGTKIFYFAIENKSDISAVKPETGEEIEIAAGREYEFWSDVSPDGKSIAYLSTAAPQFLKYSIIVRQIGSRSPKLTIEGYNPHWLPDSRRISFTRWSEAEQKNLLWIADTENGAEKLITNAGVLTPSHGNLPKNRGEIGVADWLADTGKFIYINSESPKNVWLASLDSSEIVNLTNNEKPDMRYSSPLFSADGRRVIFVSRETIENRMIYGLWMWEAGGAKKILSGANGLRILGWTASGKEILLGSTEGAMKAMPQDVKLLQVALSGETRIISTFKNIYSSTMTLASDGKTAAFTARQNNKDDIWTVDIKGGAPKKITANGSARLYYASLAWSPDGKTIFFDKQEQTDTISMFENFN